MNDKVQQTNGWLLAAAVLLVSLQALLLMGLIVSWLPTAYTYEVADIFPRGRAFFSREYDLDVFRLFILSGIFLSLVAHLRFRKDLQSSIFTQNLRRFVAVTGVWAVLGFWAAFEMIVHGQPTWARWVLGVAIVGNIISLVCFSSVLLIWPQLHRIKELLVSKVLSDWFIVRVGIALGLAVFLAHLPRFIAAPPDAPSLPYFWPLRFSSVGIFVASFVAPIIYMVIGLMSFRKLIDEGCARAAWRFVFCLCGALSFISYVRYPVNSGLSVALWPMWPLAALSIQGLLTRGIAATVRRAIDRLSPAILVSILTGIQVALVFVWAQEHLKLQVAPAQFSMIIYAIFMFVSVAVYWGSMFWRIKTDYSFVTLQVFLVSLMSMAWFKLVFYDYRADLARFWFDALALLTLAQPLIWYIKDKTNFNWPKIGFKVDILVVALIAAAVFVPDIEAMCAHIFMGEYMHHTDTFVMGPAWAVAHGAVIDVDTYSRYGIGSIPFFIGLMKLQGGISYLHLFTAIVWICTVYFVLVYVFLRRWIGSTLLALGAWMMTFKAHIGFELAYPFVFTYPQSTVARQCPDIVWMILMLLFVETGKRRWLVTASVMAGFSLWYMPSIGLYMVIAQAVVSVMYAWRLPLIKERILASTWPTTLALGSAIMLFTALCGQWFFKPVFWHNAVDFVKMFLYINTVPLTQALISKQFLNIIVFFGIVLVYVATIIKVGLDYLRGGNNCRRDWLALGLSIYGLGLLEHYVSFSIGNNYYTKTVPFFIVLFHWVSRAVAVMPVEYRVRVTGGIAVAAFIALVTSHSFMSYPGGLNISKTPLLDKRVARPLPDGRPYFYHKQRSTTPANMLFDLNSLGQTDEDLATEGEFKSNEEMIKGYHKRSDFSLDANLIASLTKRTDKVPLISSYEVRILMQADRRPFFFIFPLLDTRPLTGRSLPNDMMDARRDLGRMIKDLEEQKPLFVFTEKIMLSDNIPVAYRENMTGLIELLDYVKLNYEPVKEGHFLMALKRKGSN